MEKENSKSLANVNKQQILEFSPIKALYSNNSKSDGTTPQLICGQFQKNLSLNFGNVPVNSTRSIKFSLKNPDDEKTLSLAFIKVDSILISFEKACNSEPLELMPCQSVQATAHWTPLQECTLREIVKVKLDNNVPSLQIVFQGIAINEKNQKKPKLNVIKVAKLHQSSEVVNSDNCETSQNNCFLDWINSILVHSHFHELEVDSNGFAQQNDALGMNKLLGKQADAKARHIALSCFRSQNLIDALRAVKDDIGSGKLRVREDREILQDLGLHEALFGILFSYEMTWLCLALKVLFGDFPITLHQTTKSKVLFKKNIIERFLSDSEIQSQCCPKEMLPSQEKKMRSELRKSFVFKFLSLILILDVIRICRVLPSSALFGKDSIYKSSKDVLLSFCRCFLRGEGDFVKHLSALGYSVSYVQSYVDEFDYSVKNLAIDFRDGVRLARLFDVLTKSTRITEQLRVPAVSRLQKLHNVGIVVSQLQFTNEKPIDAKQIVDGNKAVTTGLLWKLLMTHEIERLVTPLAVMKEITQINSWRCTVNTHGISLFSHTNGDHSALTLPHVLEMWSSSIAQQNSVLVNDLSASFADCRAFCLLINYYHPVLLPLNSIKKTISCLSPPTENQDCVVRENELKKALNGERRNYLILKKVCNDIGGIPFMPPEFDSYHAPDQKSVVAFLAFLFVRLTETAQQIRAARRIQSNVRKILLDKERTNIVLLKNRVNIDENLDTVNMLQVVSSALNEQIETEKLLLFSLESQAAESVVTSQVNEFVCEVPNPSNLTVLEIAESIVERETVARLHAEALLRDCLTENAKERSTTQSLIEQKIMLEEKLRAEIEQREHDKVVRTQFEENNVLLEREARLLSESMFLKEKDARAAIEAQMVIEIEARRGLEMKLAEMERLTEFEAESLRTSLIERKRTEFRRQHAATCIQNVWKRMITVKIQRCVTTGVIRLQATFRGSRARKTARCAILAVQILQSTWRRRQWSKTLVLMNSSSVQIQRAWFNHKMRGKELLKASATIFLVKWWKCLSARRQFRSTIIAVVYIQKAYRRHHAVSKFSLFKRSLIKIQQFVKRAVHHNQHSRRIHAVCVLQKFWKQLSRKFSLIVAQKSDNFRKFCLQNSSSRRISAFFKKAIRSIIASKAATAIARWYRVLLPRLRFCKMCSGFKRLAALFRSKKVRRVSSSSVQKMMLRIVAANNRAEADPSLKIGRQTVAALTILQNGKMVSHVLKACQTLEMSTQYSKRCCEAFANGGAPLILFNLLRSCNRSTPHQELLRIVLIVLLHVARHDCLAGIVADCSDASESLVDLMQMFRDKKPLFILAAELLSRLVRASQASKNACNSPVLRKRLEGILHIMERKSRLEVRVRSVESTKTFKDKEISVSNSPCDEFAKYKGNAYKSIEPINCIQHLMQLINS